MSSIKISDGTSSTTSIPQPPKIEEVHQTYAKLPILFHIHPTYHFPIDQPIEPSHLQTALQTQRYMIGVEIQASTMIQFLDRHKEAMAKEKMDATTYVSKCLLAKVSGPNADLKIHFYGLPRDVIASLMENNNGNSWNPATFVATIEFTKPLPYQDLLQHYCSTTNKNSTVLGAEMFQKGSPYEKYIYNTHQRLISSAFNLLTFLKLDFNRDFTSDGKGIVKPLFYKIHGLPDLARDHHNQYVGIVHQSNAPMPLIASELYGLNPNIQYTLIGKQNKLCACKMTSHLFMLPLKCEKKHLPEYENRCKYERI
jgi:hypothetical protein